MSGKSKKNLRNRLGADTSERRKDIIRILSEVADCQSSETIRKRKTREFSMFAPRTPIFSILEKADLKFYGEPQLELEKDSVLKSLEFVRSELENRLQNRYTLLSAFTGAVIVSIITLILSNFI